MRIFLDITNRKKFMAGTPMRKSKAAVRQLGIIIGRTIFFKRIGSTIHFRN